MDLPDDCWELVFTSLGEEKLLHPISLVSRRFLSITNRLRSDLTISDQAASRLLLRFPNLRRIAISNFSGNLDLLLREIARSGLKIEAIDLRGSLIRFPRSSIRHLGSKFRVCLKSLNLAQSPLENDDVIAIAEFFPNLESLNIRHPKGISDLNLAVTDAAIEVLSANLSHLKSIDLSGNPLLSNLSLLSLSKNCSNLTEITAQDCNFIKREAISFLLRHSPQLSSLSLNTFPSLSKNLSPPALRHLHLSRMLIPDDLLSSLEHSSIQIEALSLSYCWGLSSSSLASFLHFHGRSLRSLVLSGLSFLCDDLMESVLPHLRSLKSISLSFCCHLGSSTFFSILRNCMWIEDIEMRKTTIGQGIPPSTPWKNTNLKSLHLKENPHLDDATLETMARSCPNLDSLDLSSCWDLTEEGLRSIGERCPKITSLCIKGCPRIRSLGGSLGFKKLKSLRADGSGMNDEALHFLSHGCQDLLVLDLDGCSHVSEKGVKDVIFGCKMLQELYLGCPNVDLNVLNWVLPSKLLLRKIVWQSSTTPSSKFQDLLLRHGCVVRT